jgi:ubiquinone/menaquinone biosynthesis C-methylase UbiE
MIDGTRDVRCAYDAWAPTYDTVDNPTRDLDRVATRATLAGLSFASVLELGCGTGKNTPFLAEIGRRVRAVDFSEAMLARARETVIAANVTFETADITRAWPCPDGSVDLIVTNLVLEHIEDLDHIFAEAARCLMRGGVFFVSELHPAMQYLGKQARFGEGEEMTRIPAFVHHISDFVAAAQGHGLVVERLEEWWDTSERVGAPRLVSFVFGKG